jgi:hypothetical protein
MISVAAMSLDLSILAANFLDMNPTVSCLSTFNRDIVHTTSFIQVQADHPVNHKISIARCRVTAHVTDIALIEFKKLIVHTKVQLSDRAQYRSGGCSAGASWSSQRTLYLLLRRSAQQVNLITCELVHFLLF